MYQPTYDHMWLKYIVFKVFNCTHIKMNIVKYVLVVTSILNVDQYYIVVKKQLILITQIGR